MLRYANSVVIILLAIGLLLLWQRQSTNIVYIDSSKLLNGYTAMLDARKDYATKEKKWRDNIDTLTNAVQRSLKTYERQMNSMSPREQSLSKQLLDAKQKQLMDYQRAIQAKAREENDKMTRAVVSQVDAFLSTYGKAHDYDLILIASQAGTISYARPGLDITDEVLVELNKTYIKPR